MTFTQQMIADLEAANYFGDDGGEAQAEIKRLWIKEMESFGKFATGQRYSQESFDNCAELSLHAAIKEYEAWKAYKAAKVAKKEGGAKTAL